jgi:hypothetical protein
MPLGPKVWMCKTFTNALFVQIAYHCVRADPLPCSMSIHNTWKDVS